MYRIIAVYFAEQQLETLRVPELRSPVYIKKGAIPCLI